MITFTTENFLLIKKYFGSKNMTCYNCKKKLNKNNIGAILSPKTYICKSILCIITAMEEGKFQQGK